MNTSHNRHQSFQLNEQPYRNTSTSAYRDTPTSAYRDTPTSAYYKSNREFTSKMEEKKWFLGETIRKLYEMDDDSVRKDFLNEYFIFMKKRGTAVAKIPVVAKLPLDLYKLYNVVQKYGGFAQVVKKRRWSQIVRALGLPTSITSAAFTLRTQYMRLLYPFECKKNGLCNEFLAFNSEYESLVWNENVYQGQFRESHYYNRKKEDGVERESLKRPRTAEYAVNHENLNIERSHSYDDAVTSRALPCDQKIYNEKWTDLNKSDTSKINRQANQTVTSDSRRNHFLTDKGFPDAHNYKKFTMKCWCRECMSTVYETQQKRHNQNFNSTGYHKDYHRSASFPEREQLRHEQCMPYNLFDERRKLSPRFNTETCSSPYEPQGYNSSFMSYHSPRPLGRMHVHVKEQSGSALALNIIVNGIKYNGTLSSSSKA